MSESPDLQSSLKVRIDSKQARRPGSTEGVAKAAAAWQKILHRGLTWFGAVAPGLALAGLLAWGGAMLATFVGETLLGFEKTPISAIMMTILLGLTVRNVAGLPVAYEAGLFLGTAIHETSQVAGAGLMYQQRYDAPTALNVAATTKLVRNVCMGAVIPMMAVFYHRRNTSAQSGQAARLKWYQYVPLFVVAFVILTAVRTICDLGAKAFGVIPPPAWHGFIANAKSVSVVCLTVAMGAVGLGTSVAQLRKLGWKPLLVGLAAAVLVGGVSIALIKLFAAAL